MTFEKDRPPSPPSSLKSFSTDFLPPIERSLTCQSRAPSPTEFAFDWILKVTAVLSAILFGIWAPVSYRLQDLGNKSNDVSQTQLIQKIEQMGREVEGLKKQMERVALLRAWEFCVGEGREKLPACQSMLKEGDMNALIADLAPKPMTTTPITGSITSPPLSSKTIASRVASTMATRIPEEDGPQHDELGNDYPVVSNSVTTPLSIPAYTIPPCAAHSATSTVPCSVHQPLSAPSSFGGFRVDVWFMGVLLVGLVIVQTMHMRRNKKRKVDRGSTERVHEELLAAKNQKDSS